jgi:hypothetical protein
MLETLLVYSFLTSAMFYLGSRAIITRWLWSRYPSWLASWADCAACSGFWYGLIVGNVGYFYVSYAPHPIVVALCSMVWTPIVSAHMQAGIERLGSAVEPDDGQS